MRLSVWRERKRRRKGKEYIMRKGQLSVNNIFSFIVLLVIMAVCSPMVATVLNVAVGYGDLTDTVIALILPLMWVAVIGALFLSRYNQGQQFGG